MTSWLRQFRVELFLCAAVAVLALAVGKPHGPRVAAVLLPAALGTSLALRLAGRSRGTRLALAVGGFLLAAAAWEYVPTTTGYSRARAAAAVEALEGLPAGDVEGYSAWRRQRDEVLGAFSELTLRAGAAELAWLNRSLDEAIGAADGRLPDDPRAATARLRRAKEELGAVEGFGAQKGRLREPREKAVRAALEAARREALDVVARKKNDPDCMKAAAEVARHLQDDFGQEAADLNITEVEIFAQNYAFLADLEDKANQKAGEAPRRSAVVNENVRPGASERAPRKVAFLVGISKYDHDFPALDFAEHDATELGEVLLKDAGFDEVVVMTGSATGDARATRKNIEQRLADLLGGHGDEGKKVRKGDLVLVALSGHGQQLFVPDPNAPGGKREDMFFAPVDGEAGKADRLVNLSRLLDDVLASKGARSLVLVDACRKVADPNKGKGIEGRDLALRGETAVLFSCERGETSWENKDVKHGVFNWAVLQGLKGKAGNYGVVTWSSLTSYVEEAMDSDEFKKLMPSGYTQTPIATGGPIGRVVLLNSGGGPGPKVAAGEKEEKLAAGEKEEEFEYVIDGQKRRGKRRVLTLDVGGGQTMELVRIKAGSFLMGAPDGEKSAEAHEKPQRRVIISGDYYLGKYAVTQAQYKAVTGRNPSYFYAHGFGHNKVRGLDTDRFPVERVSWDDAVAFCEAVAKKTGRKVCLPREAEWEYACRAGTTTPFYFGSKLNGDLANCLGVFDPYGTDEKGTYLNRITEVGSYPANPWGLYDMSGNVYQWCQDYYGPYEGLKHRDPVREEKDKEGRHVLRGGAWCNDPWQCRAAYRSWTGHAGEAVISVVGFRACLRTD
jgi:formylglycine-generating enzyme required for sulfatase activity